MTPAHWHAVVTDSPESEPYAMLGDLVVAVRTPRSRDFVSVEVATTSRQSTPVHRIGNVLLLPKPFPCMADQWHGEVQIGVPVHFEIEGADYQLTLQQLSEHASGLPWITCELLLERE